MRKTLALFSVCFATAVAATESLPDGALFIGLKQGVWKPYILSGGQARPVGTVVEPRTATYDAKHGLVAYVGADNHLHEVSVTDGQDRVLLTANKQKAFTQPAYAPDGSQLFVVEMKDGASADTEIVAMVNKGTDPPRPVTRQPAAQFEPRAVRDGYLLYSSVSCVVGCGRIIQEIWRKHLASDEAEQITLTNAIARQPVASADGKWIYFSSNRAGHYHLWRTAGAGLPLEQITHGDVADVSPALDRDGNLYFVRHADQGTRLMRRALDGRERALAMPADVDDLRNLEINP